ncbi:arsenate reductase ArsC [Amycolatopsis oliviviridis]|uniref:Low molecular weight phosphatase family protein n=1 Tax=Amycolatopsis oliviviridis TaxID=1471590 RepID=A0ABQ3LJX6_9PSEU|nr:low molecular weight phosphatase family protein [Amycolatopsis oliviviridis]GHH17763.1 low molecular weight phosphatase family protein [Amycolatopsis oliviviridis]
MTDILFVCVHNASRSQMAAALLKHHGFGRVTVRSAGCEPADEINPLVAGALAEWDVDISGEVPSQVTYEDVAAADVVITMGCQTYPVAEGTRYVEWVVPNPEHEGITGIRPLRDDMDRRVRELLSSLVDGRSPRTAVRL